MKFTLFVFAVLVAFIAVPAVAQMEESNPVSDAADSTSDAADSASEAADEASESADQVSDTMGGESDAGMGSEIEATISSIDADKGEFKVNDLSGVERTYEVSDSQILQDLQEGDKVKITPDAEDPTKAQSVEKSEPEAGGTQL